MCDLRQSTAINLIENWCPPFKVLEMVLNAVSCVRKGEKQIIHCDSMRKRKNQILNFDSLELGNDETVNDEELEKVEVNCLSTTDSVEV